MAEQFSNSFDRSVRSMLRLHASNQERQDATDRVETVYRHLVNPDEFMVAAGIRELGYVVPHFKNMPADFQRRTVECMWRAMLERSRT